MVERQIKLTAKEDVKEFVNEASKCDFDIDIFYNRVVIDAKSILGVLSMDLTRVLTVRCNGQDERFNNFFEQICSCVKEDDPAIGRELLNYDMERLRKDFLRSRNIGFGRMGLPEFFRLGEDGSDKKCSQGLFLCDRIGIWINKKKK